MPQRVLGQSGNHPWRGREDRENLAGLRPTWQRRAVVRALEAMGVFASAQAVHAAIDRGGDHVGLSTVYRSLHALAKRGRIDTIRGHDGAMLYRKCADGPHHHLVCRQCGATVEIQGGAVADLVQRWALEAGYQDLEHSLAAFGTCSRCRIVTPRRE